MIELTPIIASEFPQQRLPQNIFFHPLLVQLARVNHHVLVHDAHDARRQTWDNVLLDAHAGSGLEYRRNHDLRWCVRLCFVKRVSNLGVIMRTCFCCRKICGHKLTAEDHSRYLRAIGIKLASCPCCEHDGWRTGQRHARRLESESFCLVDEL